MELIQSSDTKPTGSFLSFDSLLLPSLIKKFLLARGFDTKTKFENLLKSSLADMKDPLSLSGVEASLLRFEKALVNKEKICVYGDFDLDGSSGLALTMDALSRMGFRRLCYYQPKRLSEGYGLHAHAVEKLKEDGVSLIFTVDVGITAIEAVARANEIGVDVIISDHHLPKEVLPEAFAVINPNSGNCDSGLGHLCGAGVAFYVMIALRKFLKEKSLLENDFNPKELLDLFIIGTLTDMVPLIDENRALCKHGLIEFKNTKRPGLKKLMDRLGYVGKDLSGQDIAIGIAPKLNALSRLEMGILPVDVLLAKDETYAEGIIDEVLRLNDQRRNLQFAAETKAEEKYLSDPTDRFCFVWSEDFHQGVLGLVATRISQNYELVSFIASCNENGKMVGSARVPDGSVLSLPEVLEYCAEFLDGFGGHAQAAGFHLEKENAEAFRMKLQEYFLNNSTSATDASEKNVVFDCEADLGDLDGEAANWIAKLGPYGQGFPVPIFKVKNVQIIKKNVLRGGHLKFRFQRPGAKSNALDGLCFSPARSISKINEGDFVDICAQLQWNYFAGRKSIQLLITSIIVH